MKRSIRWAWLVFLSGIVIAVLPLAWAANPGSPAPAVKTASAGYLENVVFERLPGKERVTLELSRQSGVAVEKRPGNIVLIRLKNSLVPEELRRSLGDKAMVNILRVAPAPKADEDLSWPVAIELKQMVPYNVRQQGMNVLVEFNVTSVAGAGLSPEQDKTEMQEQPTAAPPAPPSVQKAQPERAVAPAENGKTKKTYSGARISLDVQEAEIKSVLRLLSEVGKVSIVAGDDVKGPVTLSIKETPWDQALDIILGITGLFKIEKNNVIMVVSQKNLDALKKSEEEKFRQEKRQLDREPLITRIVPIKYRMLKMAVPTVDERGQKVEEKGVAFKKDVLLSSISGESAAASVEGKVPIVIERATAAAGPKAEEKKIEEGVYYIQFLHNFLSRDVDGNRRGWIAADADTNSVIITAIKRDMDIILDMIAKTDVPTDQVLIKATIVETTKSTAREIGIQWGGAYGRYVGNQSLYITPGGTGGSTVPPGSALSGGYTPTSGATGVSGQGYAVNFPASAISGASPAALGMLFGTIGGNILDLQLSALQNDNKLNILSSPSLVTSDNQTASTEHGKEVPYITPGTSTSPPTVTWKKVVLRLEITPHVIDRKNIKMSIAVKKDEQDFNTYVEIGDYKQYGLTVKDTKTDLVVADGETIVISGLTNQTKSGGTTGLPWLKDIPVLGWLFKKDAKEEEMSEVLIFITPNLIKSREIGQIQTGF